MVQNVVKAWTFVGRWVKAIPNEIEQVHPFAMCSVRCEESVGLVIKQETIQIVFLKFRLLFTNSKGSTLKDDGEECDSIAKNVNGPRCKRRSSSTSKAASL